MKNRNNSLSFLILLTLFCALSVMVAAQPQDFDNLNPTPAAKNEPLATATRNRNEINWRPKVEFESLVLTVSFPDGQVFRQEFADGKAPQFKLVDDKGAALPDGSYNYELRLTPKISQDVKEALKEARENGNDGEKEREFKKNGKLPGGEIVQTGSFLIARGNVQIAKLEGGEQEALPGKGNYQTVRNAFDAQNRLPAGLRFLPAAIKAFDQVIPDDLIVQGSACVGFDCVNGESFSFDTIRLKENNTRIGFSDTSVGAFPTNDWELTANDSTSGGVNRFTIRDVTAARDIFTVRAGAAANSILVDSASRVGLRTSTPVLDLHIATSNTPAHRLEQNNSGGFTAQTWDIGGNEANFFVRDVTSGSRLPFRIRPGAPTSSIDIAASGNVGIGTASPSFSLDVTKGTSDTFLRAHSTGAGSGFLLFGNSTGGVGAWQGTPSGDLLLNHDGLVASVFASIRSGAVANTLVLNSGRVGIGVSNPTNPIQHSNGAFLSAGGAWTNGSSRVLKTNIRQLSASAALKTLGQMNPVTFEYKTEPGESYVGFIAEEVPEMVATNDRQGLSPMDIVAVLTKVVQEQQQLITDLKVKVDRLEKTRARKTRRAIK